MGQWSDLLPELLIEIEGHLTLHVDKVRIRAICLSWNSYLPKMTMTMPDKLPSLLGVFENQSESVALFNLVEHKYDTLCIPELQRKLFRGSSFGWVAMHDDIPDDWVPTFLNYDDQIDGPNLALNIPRRVFPGSSPELYLFNPFTGVQIRLPPRYTFPDVKDYCVDKVGQEYTINRFGGIDFIDSNYLHRNWLDKIVTSSSPLKEDCIVVAIYGELGTLTWCKCNDKSWTPIGETEFLAPHVAYTDAIFYKDRLHALKIVGQLVVIENIGTNKEVVETVVADAPNGLNPTNTAYLVATSDDAGLLMVHQEFVDEEYFVGFKVYKLNSETCCWCKVDSIGDDMLFLGIHSSSLSINARNVPGYKGNCIYFADESIGLDISGDGSGQRSLATKVGVFNLADRTIESLSCSEDVHKFRWPAPVWITSPNS